MFRPFGMSRPPRSVPRALFAFALLVVGLVANLSLIRVANATVQDSFSAAYDLSPDLTTVQVHSDPATSVNSFTRDLSVETSTLGGCGNYPSNTSVNTYSAWYKFTPPAGGGWLTLSTLQTGTNYDTVLDVWHDSVSSATRVACNDDAVSGNRGSELSIPVVDTSTYYIAIRRYGSLAMPPSPTLAFYARFATSPEIYVDQNTGSDANPGSITFPVRTIQKGVDLAPVGAIVYIAAGAYGEDVVLNKSLTLIGTGNPTATSFTLQSGVLGANSGGITAGLVNVQALARIADGILLAAPGGSVMVDGSHTESVTIGKNLTLQSTNGATLSSSGATITVNTGTVRITGFNMSGTPALKVNAGNVTADANWWGSATGPQTSTNSGGTGSAIVGTAFYRPWCTVPAPTCTAVGGIATMLAFNPSPNDSTVGVSFTQQPWVEARDSAGNVDTSFNGEVTLTLTGGTPGAMLKGTVKVTAVAGVAKFTDLYVDTVGANYMLTATSNTLTGDSNVFNIGQATQTISFSPSSVTGKVFGDPPFSVTASASSGLPVTITASGSCNYDNATKTVTITGAGTCTLDANQPGDTNYLSASNQLIISIGKATPTISFNPAAIGTQTYSPTPYTINLAVTSNSTGTKTYSGTSGVCSYDGTQVTVTGVGTCTVTVDQATDANYLAGSSSLSFTVAKDAPTFTFTPDSIGTQTYSPTPYTISLSVTSNSGGTITYSGTSGVCTYDGAQVTVIGAGTCIVYANQAADTNYNAGMGVRSFTVNPASATTTLVNQTYTYDTTAKPASFTTTPSPLQVTVTYNGSTAVPINAGTYAVHIASADPNYTITSGADATLTINPASATTTLVNQSYVYNGAPRPASFTTTPNPLAVSVTYNGSATVPTNAGSYAVHIASANTNYVITSGTDATLTITKASQTITFAQPPNKTYGDPPFALNATATSGLPVSFSAAGNCTITRGIVTLTGAGSCTITASQAGNANWGAAADVAQTFTINKRPQSITFGPLPTRAVSNPPFTVSAIATSGLPVSFSATGSCSVSGTTVTLSGVGSCTITASQSGDVNWAAAASVPQTFAILTSFKTYLPALIVPLYPDLVGSFEISDPNFDTFDPVRITVTVTNTGDAPASDFWVDFYINPLLPPTDTNQPWDQRCGSVRCKFGIAWYVADTIAPGQSITLYSTPGSYFAKNTDWPGYFETKKLDLYLYVDSWNPGIPNGAVVEKNEANNRAELHLGGVQAASVADAPAPTQALPALPARPVRPSEDRS